MFSTSVSDPLPVVTDGGRMVVPGIAVVSVTLKLLGPVLMSAAVCPLAIPS